MTIAYRSEPAAIRELYNNAECIIEADVIFIVRDGDKVLATDAEITAIQNKVAEYDVEWTANEYARNRKKEYDALNQFELLFDDKANDTTTWDDAVNAIKAKYPKPE